jgi:AraC-like DNA-binding protein
MQRHCLLATADVLTYFVEPHCAFADRLREHYGDGITAAPELRDLSEDDVRPAGSRGSDELDPRLVIALNVLADTDISLPSLAAEVGLSPQRLRALARQQLGMPSARWRVWTRLRRAAETLQSGVSRWLTRPPRRASPTRRINAGRCSPKSAITTFPPGLSTSYIEARIARFIDSGHWWSTRLDTTVSTELAPKGPTSASPMLTRHCTTAWAASALSRANASTSGSGSNPMICARGSTRLRSTANDPVPQTDVGDDVAGPGCDVHDGQRSP